MTGRFLSPREAAAYELSRRGFLRRAGLGAAGIAIGGPALLAACSKSSSPRRDVRVFNAPLAIDDNTQSIFERTSGVFLDYHEYTDAEAYLRASTRSLRAHHDIGADVVVLPDAQTATVIASGWARPLASADGARHRALPAFANPGFDPGRKFSLPYSSSMVGLAYDRRRVHEPVRSAGALFDPKFRGRVAMSADAAETLGLVALASGNDPAKVTASQAAAAVQRVRGAVAGGQVRSFATTEYVDDLVSGRALLAVARADDVLAALPVSPTLAFVVPDEGGLFSSTNMLIPIGARNRDEAAVFVNFMFGPDACSRIASFTNGTMAVAGAGDSLQAIDAKAASNPLISPSPAVVARLRIWAANGATTAATAQFASLVVSHTAPAAP